MVVLIGEKVGTAICRNCGSPISLWNFGTPAGPSWSHDESEHHVPDFCWVGPKAEPKEGTEHGR